LNIEIEQSTSSCDFKIMNKDIMYVKIFTFNVDNKKCDKVNIIDANNFKSVTEDIIEEIQQQRDFQPNIISFTSMS